MQNRSSKIGLSAFLIIIVATTELPYFFKYPMLAVAAISLAISGYKYYQEKKDAATTK